MNATTIMILNQILNSQLLSIQLLEVTHLLSRKCAGHYSCLKRCVPLPNSSVPLRIYPQRKLNSVFVIIHYDLLFFLLSGVSLTY